MWPISWRATRLTPRGIVADSVTFAESSELPSTYEDLMRNTYVNSDLVHKTAQTIGAGID